MPSRRRCNHGGGQIWRVGERPAPPRFIISVAQVERLGRANLDVKDAWQAVVTDTESGEAVHTTERQPRELDAKVAAGLWVEEKSSKFQVQGSR